jgi:hypothetical protein
MRGAACVNVAPGVKSRNYRAVATDFGRCGVRLWRMS